MIMTNTLQRILSIGAVLILLAVAGGALLLKDSPNEPIGCTLEAKICPDGSAVGRTGSNCEFAACPNPQAGGGQGEEGIKEVTLHIGETALFEGVSFTITKVEDSRCATGVICIWAGEAKVTIKAVKNGDTENRVVLEKHGAAVFSLHIAVDNITPYPRANAPTEQGNYLIHLTLSKQ